MYFVQYVLAAAKESFSLCLLQMNMHWHCTHDSEVHLPPLYYLLLPHPYNCVLNFESSEVEKRDTFRFPCSGAKPTDVCALFWKKRENLEKS